MSTDNNKREQNRESPIFLVMVVFFVIVGFWLLITSRENPMGKGQAELSSQGAGLQGKSIEMAVDPDHIDNLMKQSLMKHGLRRKHMENENARLAPGVGPIKPENIVGDPEYDYGVEMGGKSHGEQVLEDLEQNDQGPGYEISTEQKIDSRMARDQWLDEYDRAFNKEYADEFIENARKDGVDIRLNENGDIISIRRVKKPNEAIRIPQSVK